MLLTRKMKAAAKKKEKQRIALIAYGKQQYNLGMVAQKAIDDKLISGFETGIDSLSSRMERSLSLMEKTGNKSIETMTESSRSTSMNMTQWHTSEINQQKIDLRANVDLLKKQASNLLNERIKQKDDEILELKGKFKSDKDKLILGHKEALKEAVREGVEMKSNFEAQRSNVTKEKHKFEDMNQQLRGLFFRFFESSSRISPDLKALIQLAARVQGKDFTDIVDLSVEYDKLKRNYELSGLLVERSE